MDNFSANVCNLSYQVPSPIPYIAISVAHMLFVIVPTVLLGATILYHVRADREMRDPITALFCAVTITSMLSPVTFGLLLDMSTITDLPLSGSCSPPSRAIRMGTLYFLRMLTPCQIALITCTQFYVIKYGKKITARHVLAVFGVVTVSTAIASILLIASGAGAYGGAVPKIRGSWCEENEVVLRNYLYQSAALAVIIIICPVTLVVAFSVQSYLIVKQSTTETDRLVRSVLLVSVATLVLEFTIKIPAGLLYYVSIVLNSLPIFYLSITTGDTENCFVLLLFLTTHRGIRKAVFSKVINYFKNRNTVSPQA